MLKKVLIITFVFLMLFQSAAFAQTMGEIILRDTLYGAAVGAALGSAIWLIDPDDFEGYVSNLGIGLTVGILGGLAFGVVDAKTSFVSIDRDGVKFALPEVNIQKRGDEIIYSTSVLRAEF